MSRLPARRESVTVKLRLLAGAPAEGGHDGHLVHVTMSFDPVTGMLNELFFVSRGKSGHGLDQILMDLGVQLSRAIQGRDPETGAEIPPCG